MSFLGPLQPWEAADDSEGSFPFSELDWLGVGSSAQAQLRSTSSTDSMHTLFLSPTVVKIRAATAGPSILRRDNEDPSQGVPAKSGTRLQTLKSRQQEFRRARSAQTPTAARRAGSVTNVPSMICTSMSLPLPRGSIGMAADLGERQRSLPAVVNLTGDQRISSRPVSERPDVLMAAVLRTLSESNAAQRTELDWQAQNEALMDARQLVRLHPHVVAQQSFALVGAVMPAVEALRSQTARNALILLQELLAALGKAADPAADVIIAAAAKKAGEVSRAGRENVLTKEADCTLAAAVAHLSECRVASALLACAGHKNPNVRAKAALHLDACVHAHDPARLAAAQGLPERLFAAAAGFLDEGSPEARACGKRIVWTLRRRLLRPDQLQAALEKLASPGLRRKAREAAESGMQPPPPPVPAWTALGCASSCESRGSGSRGGMPAEAPVLGPNRASPFTLQ